MNIAAVTRAAMVAIDDRLRLVCPINVSWWLRDRKGEMLDLVSRVVGVDHNSDRAERKNQVVHDRFVFQATTVQRNCNA